MGLDWPGRGEGLSDRESEILALITQGKSNADVAKLTYLSPNTVKSYIRTIYRKIDVGGRTQAVLWHQTRLHPRSPPHRALEGWALADAGDLRRSRRHLSPGVPDSFLDSPPDQRQQIVQELQSYAGAQQYVGPVLLIANTCNNF